MTIKPPSMRQLNQKSTLLLLSVAAGFGFLTMLMDAVESSQNNTTFYFSESFMFSSFWWLFVPLIFVQIQALHRQRKKVGWILSTALVVALHLVMFPALVWLISTLFYYHTFRYGQTFQFALTEHLVKLIIIYSLYPTYYLLKKNRPAAVAPEKMTIANSNEKTLLTSLLVNDGIKKIVIPVQEVLYLTANPPYINVFHGSKRYLYQATLKSITEQIDPGRFIRIHKTAIVNLDHVRSYSSKLNGDYDIALTTGIALRLSRNYAAHFKKAFLLTHRVGIK